MTTQCTVVVSQYAANCWQIGEQTGTGSWSDVAHVMGQNGERNVDIVLLPDWYSLHRVEFIDAEKKMLAKTVPFALEDELADDIDECHFALGVPEDNAVQVAVVQRAKLQRLIEDIKAAGLEIHALSTCPVLSEEPFWLQIGETSAALFRGAEQLVLDQRQVPALHDSAKRVVALRQDLEPWDIWQLENNKLDTLPIDTLRGGIDLLQGEFRRGIAWRVVWNAWRTPAIAAGVLMVAMIAQAWWQVGLLETRNLAFRQAIEKTYLEAFPKSRVVNPRRQMAAKLAELEGGNVSSGSNMLALLAALSVEENAASLQISGINYEARAAELRIDILADNFQQVEKIRNALLARGVKAELQNSSAAGNKVRAKLALKEVG